MDQYINEIGVKIVKKITQFTRLIKSPIIFLDIEYLLNERSVIQVIQEK